MPALLLFVIFLALASHAYAQGARAGLDLNAAIAYVWVAVWAGLGGLVSFYQKVRMKQARWFNLSELVGELGTSMFVGVVTGLLCEAGGLSPGLTFALVGVTGHAGGRAVFWLERVLQNYLENKLGVSTDESMTGREKKE